MNEHSTAWRAHSCGPCRDSPRYLEASNHSWWSRDLELGVEHFQTTSDTVAALPHTHAEYVFIFCLAGRMDLRSGDQRYLLDAGELLVHNPGQLHESCYGAGPAAEGISLIVSSSAFTDLTGRMRMPYGANPDQVTFSGTTQDSLGFELVRQLLFELHNAPLGYEVMLELLVTQLLVHLFRDCLIPSFSECRPRLPPQLPAWEAIQAMNYMATRGKKDFRLSELCAICRTSPSRFIPLFRNSTQLNPRKYFDTILIQRARALLAGGCYSTKEVAYELGFKSSSHFCRLFHDVTGTTPKLFSVGAVPGTAFPPVARAQAS